MSLPTHIVRKRRFTLRGCGSDALDGPELVQVWGPRFSVFVVRADDTEPFSLGRLPATPAKRDAAVDALSAETTVVVTPIGEVRVEWDDA